MAASGYHERTVILPQSLLGISWKYFGHCFGVYRPEQLGSPRLIDGSHGMALMLFQSCQKFNLYRQVLLIVTQVIVCSTFRSSCSRLSFDELLG